MEVADGLGTHDVSAIVAAFVLVVSARSSAAHIGINMMGDLRWGCESLT